MDAQKFLQDRLGGLMTMMAPIPSPAKMVVNLQGSSPQVPESQHKGPLFKLGGEGFQMRNDDQIYYDKELGYYGPGKL
jgi:hypothetical protein